MDVAGKRHSRLQETRVMEMPHGGHSGLELKEMRDKWFKSRQREAAAE